MANQCERPDCPFCGENELVRSNTWSGYLGRHVDTVECKCCGASAPEDKWSTRAELSAIKGAQAGEAVAWARQCDLDESDPAIFVAREEVQESGYVVALYTAPPASGAVPVPEQEMEWLEQWLLLAAEPVGQECCGQAHLECCGNAVPVYRTAEEIASAMNMRREVLRASLVAGVKP